MSKRGYEIPTIIDTLRSMSVTGCLFKPFNPDELHAGIQSVFNMRAA